LGGAVATHALRPLVQGYGIWRFCLAIVVRKDSWDRQFLSLEQLPCLALIAYFGSLPDPRAANARHRLGDLMVMMIAASLCGASSAMAFAFSLHLTFSR
jgi:hypothetical protein